MGRHVVGAFGSMTVRWQVFGCQTVEQVLDVVPYIRVEVFAQGYGRRGMLNEQVEQARSRQGFHPLFQNSGDEVDAFSEGGKLDEVLVGHDEEGVTIRI